MPTYTYECKKCGHSQDKFHSMTVRPRVKCAECGGPCRKLFGAGAGIIFKGSGFYETDYKTKRGSKGDGDSEPSKSDGSKGEGSKSDGSKSDGQSTGASSSKSESGSSKGSESEAGASTKKDS